MKARPVTRGRVVRTPAEAQPYKVVLEHAYGGETEHPFPSMKAGEAFIRSETPSPSARDGRRDSPSHRPGMTTARNDHALQTKE